MFESLALLLFPLFRFLSFFLQGIKDDFAKNIAAWKVIFDHKEPHTQQLPAPFDKLTSFEKLLVIRCIRADKVVPAVHRFVESTLLSLP